MATPVTQAIIEILKQDARRLIMFSDYLADGIENDRRETVQKNMNKFMHLAYRNDLSRAQFDLIQQILRYPGSDAAVRNYKRLQSYVNKLDAKDWDMFSKLVELYNFPVRVLKLDEQGAIKEFNHSRKFSVSSSSEGGDTDEEEENDDGRKRARAEVFDPEDTTYTHDEMCEYKEQACEFLADAEESAFIKHYNEFSQHEQHQEKMEERAKEYRTKYFNKGFGRRVQYWDEAEPDEKYYGVVQGVESDDDFIVAKVSVDEETGKPRWSEAQHKYLRMPPYEKDGLRIVNLRSDLQPVQKPDYLLPDSRDTLEQKNPTRLLPESWKTAKEVEQGTSKILAHYTNAEINTLSNKGTLLDAFMRAYNYHEDVTLYPDDVWLTILFQFSRHVNLHAEEFRHLFVNHTEGKKDLVVTTENDLDESQWDEFFKLMVGAIEENTKNGVVPLLQADFSTTGMVERMISVATIMDTFKQYFNYGRCIPCCGIKNVRFAGTLEDWERVRHKLQALAKYRWTEYVSALDPILAEFIETYKGNVNTEFWDKVMNSQRGTQGSGATTYISGWILAFYGKGKDPEDEVDVGDLKDDFVVDVPVKLDNKITGEKKNLRLRAQFAGLNETDGSYRPQLSMIVCELASDK